MHAIHEDVEYEFLTEYEECLPAQADAVDWYKMGRPYRTYRPRTIRYVSAKKVRRVGGGEGGMR